METPTPQAEAGTEIQTTATAQPTTAPAAPAAPADAIATMDTLTTAILEGAPQAEIDRISAELAPKAEPASASTPEPATASPESKPTPEPPVEPQKEPTPTPAPSPETPAPVEPKPNPNQDEPEPADSENGSLPKRVRIESLPDKDRAMVGAALMIAKGEGISFEDAFARVSGKSTEAASPAAPAQAEPIPKPTMPSVAELRAQADAIAAKLQEAGNAEGLFTPEIAELNRQYADVTADLKVAQLQEQQRTEQANLTQAQMQAAWDESMAAAKKDYPAMADKNSPLYLLASSINVRARQDSSHPLHDAVFNDPNAPRRFVDEAAKMLGIGKTQTAPSVPVAPQVPQPEQPRQVLPAPGSRSTQVSTQPQKTREQILAESEAATLAAVEGNLSSAHSGDLGILIR